jgi:pyrroloquinoline quinone (PQQ) biosynthesis protein C
MTNYSHVVDATRQDFDTHIKSHPFVALVSNGSMTVGHYIAYLRELYHYVRHTSRMLALAAGRISDDRPGLRRWFLEAAVEENGHEAFCVHDIRNLGEDPSIVLGSPPLPGAWALVAQEYYMATYGNPVGILGVASVAETLGAKRGGVMADWLVKKYGFDPKTVTFLRAHATLDQQHSDDVQKAVNECVTDIADVEAIVHGRRSMIFYYAQMFSDVIAHPYGGIVGPATYSLAPEVADAS